MNNKNMFWLAKGRKFYSKLSARKIVESVNDIKFHHFDKTFSHDWKEPQENWWTLVRRRAEQIRDENSRIRLWFSGGMDSNTVLDTFLQYRIPIDEIAVFKTTCNEDPNAPELQEFNYQAIPKLDSVRDQLRNTEVKFYRIGPEEFKRYYSYEDWPEFSHHLQFVCDGPSDLHRLFDLEPMCDIQGGEKPSVIKEDGSFYEQMIDTTRLFSFTDIDTMEDFFINESMPELHIKQSYELAKKIDKLTHERDFNHEDRRSVPMDELYNTIRTCYNQQYSLGKPLPGKISLKRKNQKASALKYAPEVWNEYIEKMYEVEEHYPGFFNNSDPEMSFLGSLANRHKL